MNFSKATILAGVALLAASGTPGVAQRLHIEPPHENGTSITGGFEGWFKNADGTFSLLVGYYNRNSAQEVDIPLGVNNRIEPGGPDRGQPTHFMPGRQWGMFVVRVPADFGQKKLTWTLVANGQETVIPLSLKPDYEVSPFQEAAGNTPPLLAFDEHGATAQGPGGLNLTRTVKVGASLPLTVWVGDDLVAGSGSGAVSRRQQAYPVIVNWAKYRGPGTVTFSSATPEVENAAWAGNKAKYQGKTTTQAVFDKPGDYVLHVYANDFSGEGGAGFECCWTYGDVKVTVQP